MTAGPAIGLESPAAHSGLQGWGTASASGCNYCEPVVWHKDMLQLSKQVAKLLSWADVDVCMGISTVQQAFVYAPGRWINHSLKSTPNAMPTVQALMAVLFEDFSYLQGSCRSVG